MAIFLGIFGAFTCVTLRAAVVLGQDAVLETVPWHVATREAHQNVWESVVLVTNPITGFVRGERHSFEEIGTGLNFFDSTLGAYVPTREEWAVQPNGSLAAQQGRHSVLLANNINLGGCVTVITPDHVRLVSNPVAIGLFDPLNNHHQILAEVRDTAPALGAKNEIVWVDCFENLRASIVHRYTRAGLAQELVLEQNIDLPEGWSDRTRLEFYTEFDPNTPIPRQTVCVLSQENGVQTSDSALDWGEMKIGSGNAFLLGNGADASGVAVFKNYEVLAGRPVLTEAVELKSIAPLLATLEARAKPADAGRATAAASGARTVPVRSGTEPAEASREFATGRPVSTTAVGEAANTARPTLVKLLAKAKTRNSETVTRNSSLTAPSQISPLAQLPGVWSWIMT